MIPLSPEMVRLSMLQAAEVVLCYARMPRKDKRAARLLATKARASALQDSYREECMAALARLLFEDR